MLRYKSKYKKLVPFVRETLFIYLPLVYLYKCNYSDLYKCNYFEHGDMINWPQKDDWQSIHRNIIPDWALLDKKMTFDWVSERQNVCSQFLIGILSKLDMLIIYVVFRSLDNSQQQCPLINLILWRIECQIDRMSAHMKKSLCSWICEISLSSRQIPVGMF